MTIKDVVKLEVKLKYFSTVSNCPVPNVPPGVQDEDINGGILITMPRFKMMFKSSNNHKQDHQVQVEVEVDQLVITFQMP